MKSDSDHYRRRRLRLAALLFRLGYMLEKGPNTGTASYRRDSFHAVEVTGNLGTILNGDSRRDIELEPLIMLCKRALEEEWEALL